MIFVRSFGHNLCGCKGTTNKSIMQVFSKRKRNNDIIFSKRKRNNSVIFSKRKRNGCFLHLNAASFGSTIGDLWEFCGFLQTRFYNNAAKIFGTEGVLCRRFVNVAIERHLKQTEGVDYQRLPIE